MGAIRNFFSGVFKEMEKVRWPSSKDMVKYSLATIALLIFFSIFFYGIDWLLVLIRMIGK